MGTRQVVGDLEVTGGLSNESIIFILENGVVPDLVLENNSWETIRKVCEAGAAPYYWSVGDTKMITGGDGYTRPATIVDMSGLYGKHVVFQFRQTTTSGFSFADVNAGNNYLTSKMNVTYLSPGGDAFNMLIGNDDLATQLTNTTVQVAQINLGSTTRLIDVTNKLFLPAEREILALSRSYSPAVEFNALTCFQYYALDTSTTARRLYNPSTSSRVIWWLRSPRDSSTSVSSVVDINTSGNSDYDDYLSGRYVAPCFAF